MSGRVGNHRRILDALDAAVDKGQEVLALVAVVVEVHEVADDTGDMGVREVGLDNLLHAVDKLLVLHVHPFRNP